MRLQKRALHGCCRQMLLLLLLLLMMMRIGSICVCVYARACVRAYMHVCDVVHFFFFCNYYLMQIQKQQRIQIMLYECLSREQSFDILYIFI